MRARFVVPLAGLIAVLVVAGCGGGDDTTTSAGASGASGEQGAALTTSEFIAQGNAICANGNKEIDAEGQKAFSESAPPSKAEEEKFVTDTVIPNVQSQIDQLRALSPPSGDEDQVNAILDAAQEGLDEGEADPSLLTQSGQNDPFAEANRLADAYGLDKCGSDSG